jgi:FSR family fosmidomycin resistance protein-like MFS transporter
MTMQATATATTSPAAAARPAAAAPADDQAATVFAVLGAVSSCHLLNDTVQSLIPAIYPMLKAGFGLSFAQVGLITLTFQLTASLLQPLVGAYTDRHPKPYSLVLGMGLSLAGLLLLASADRYALLLVAAALVGMGSSVFHPESSRVARLASGGRHGLAQSLFQVGGNLGSSLGPLLAAFIVLPRGQGSIAWFSLVALLGMAVLWGVGGWYRRHRIATAKRPPAARPARPALPRRTVVLSLLILGALMFSKFFYTASISSYYAFYLMARFGLEAETAQLYLFGFLFAMAAGTLIGGPVGDRFGRKLVIWVSILGVLPFTLALPHANLFWTAVLSGIIGLVLASAFSAILVYAQELVPGRVGTIAGLFFGLAFGMGGIGAALLGGLADRTGIAFVYHLCSFLPAIGLLTAFLPRLEVARRRPA